MTIKVTKPSINLREKLSELDFDKVPFQKMPAGSVLQVVSSNVITGTASTTSAIYAEPNTGYRVSITPKKASNTILLSFQGQFGMNGGVYMGFQFIKSTDGGVSWNSVHPNTSQTETHRNSNSGYVLRSATLSFKDSPSTTSEVIYSVQFSRSYGSSTCRINDNGLGSFLTVTEIAQ